MRILSWFIVKSLRDLTNQYITCYSVYLRDAKLSPRTKLVLPYHCHHHRVLRRRNGGPLPCSGLGWLKHDGLSLQPSKGSPRVSQTWGPRLLSSVQKSYRYHQRCRSCSLNESQHNWTRLFPSSALSVRPLKGRSSTKREMWDQAERCSLRSESNHGHP